MNLNQRIGRAIAHSGKKKSQIAKECGRTPAAVSQWISGLSKNLRQDSLHALAVACGVRMEWLASGELPMVADGKGPMQPSPTSVSETSAHYDVSHFSLLVKGELSKRKRYSPFEATNAEALIGGRNQYILIIDDHSYAPRLRRGDRVLIDPDRKPAQNDDVLITTSENKVFINCLIREDPIALELIDTRVPGSQLIIRKSEVRKVEVIAAIIPESSMPNIERRTMEDRLREIYPPDKNTW